LTQLNGTVFSEAERRDCELYYLKETYKDYLKITGQSQIESLQNEGLCAYI